MEASHGTRPADRSSTRRCATANRRPGSRCGSTRSCGWPGSSTRSAWTSSRPGFPIASEADAEAVQAVAARGPAARHRGAGARLRRRHRQGRLGPAPARRGRAFTPSSPPPTCTSSASCNMTREAVPRRGRRRPSGRPAATPTTCSSRPRTRRAATSTSCAASSRPSSTAGATTINLPDTVGYSTPDEIARVLHAPSSARVPNADRRSSARTATTTSAWRSPTRSPPSGAGVRQVECTINGIGERAGNASLEEVVMALRVRPDRLPYDTGIDTQALYRDQPAADRAHRPGASSRTRPSSAATPSRTRPASTRTAC